MRWSSINRAVRDIADDKRVRFDRVAVWDLCLAHPIPPWFEFAVRTWIITLIAGDESDVLLGSKMEQLLEAEYGGEPVREVR